MNQKDRDNIRGKIKRCLINADLIGIMGILLPVFKYSLTDDIFNFLCKKGEFILDVYEQADIYHMIISRAAEFFRYEEFSKKFKVKSEENEVLNHGKLKDFLKDKEILEVTDFILKEFKEPEYSYSLVKLPNVELSENISINEDMILVGNLEIEPEGYFRIDEELGGDFAFRLKNDMSYLLIRQLGWSWRSFTLLPILAQESLVLKYIKQKLKIFLGLSLIRGIFGITNISTSSAKRKSSLPIGVFQAIDWDEGARISDDINNDNELVPEKHPDFESLRHAFSNGDDLKYFSFQKRFFLSHEVELPQTLTDLIDSLSIGEKISKPMLNLEKGKIVPLPLPHVQRAKSLGEYLREEFGTLEILLDSSDDYAERIKAASLSSLEGRCSDNDTVKFINYTVAIESLLGEESEKNVTQALSNKCGFWLGKNLKEKEEIRKFFKNRIYDTRSRIVHMGKTILKKEDDDILRELEAITERLIKEAMETYHA